MSSDCSDHKAVLLLLSGIETNPVPRQPKFQCGICGRACKTNQHSICCDDCDQWIHKECFGITTASYSELGEKSDPWFCPTCKSANISTAIYNVPLDRTETSNRSNKSWRG